MMYIAIFKSENFYSHKNYCTVEERIDNLLQTSLYINKTIIDDVLVISKRSTKRAI